MTYDMPCQSSSLVYDPYIDQCVYESQFECKTAIQKKPCHKKPDGNYAIKDVLKFMTCKNEEAGTFIRSITDHMIKQKHI